MAYEMTAKALLGQPFDENAMRAELHLMPGLLFTNTGVHEQYERNELSQTLLVTAGHDMAVYARGLQTLDAIEAQQIATPNDLPAIGTAVAGILGLPAPTPELEAVIRVLLMARFGPN